MRNRLVPRTEWLSFFQGFSRRHPGWPTTVWLMAPRIGAQVEARDLPLRGIVSDPLATSISIHLGDSPGRNVEHAVSRPIAVWLEMTETGADAALGINSADGSTTLIEFRPPAPDASVFVRPPAGETATHAARG
jgi:hypothetical protein